MLRNLKIFLLATLSLILSAPVLAVPIGNIGFSESIGSVSLPQELTHTTDGVTSNNQGVGFGSSIGVDFTILKTITNFGQFRWTDFHVQLQSFNGSTFVNSPETDGISFRDGQSSVDWVNAFQVWINNTQKSSLSDGWTVVRNSALDLFDVYFTGFYVEPGQSVSLVFNMSDNDNNTWRLDQVASIPEPQTYALMMAGLLMLGFMARRRMGQ